ncbi:MAG TPA: hypothetical protein VIK14_12945 [Ignavibacteria bacterium]
MVDKLSLYLFIILQKLVCIFPIRLVQRAGKVAGLVFFYLIPIRKKVALSNLNICFPENDLSWKKSIIKKSYINLCIILFELLYLPKLSKEKAANLIRYGGEVKEEVFLDKNNLRFFLSAHFSNWEYSAYTFPQLFGEKLDIIVKTQANQSIDRKINELRQKSGNEIIPIGLSLRGLFEKMRKKGIVCFLVDQSAHSEYSVYVEFFGKNVATFSGPAKLALKFRPVLIFSVLIRDDRYNYTIITNEIHYDDLIDSNEENVKILTHRVQKKLEEMIRKYPEQWLWFHKRFKYMRD